MRDNTTEIFEKAPVPKAVLLNVIPSIISMMMVLVYNLADYGGGDAFRHRRNIFYIQNAGGRKSEKGG